MTFCNQVNLVCRVSPEDVNDAPLIDAEGLMKHLGPALPGWNISQQIGKNIMFRDE